MTFARPHWLTAIVGTVGTICAGLLAANSFPQYTAYLGMLAALCTALSVPTVTSAPKPATVASERGYTKVSSMMWLAGLALACAVAACGGALLAGCTPAQTAEWKSAEAVVLADVNAGDSLQKIESDVAAIYIGADSPLVLTIIDDALTLLEDTGAIALADTPHESEIHQLVKVARAK